MERNLSTEEKFSELAKRLLGKGIHEDASASRSFSALKALRDDIVHQKLIGHYVRGGSDRQTIYYRFLQVPPLTHPRNALRCIEAVAGERRDRWMRAAADAIRAASTAS